jgi:hypothetical protein
MSLKKMIRATLAVAPLVVFGAMALHATGTSKQIAIAPAATTTGTMIVTGPGEALRLAVDSVAGGYVQVCLYDVTGTTTIGSSTLVWSKSLTTTTAANIYSDIQLGFTFKKGLAIGTVAATLSTPTVDVITGPVGTVLCP